MTPANRLIVLLAASLYGCLLTGCDTSCTEIGCQDGVVVEFQDPLDGTQELSFVITEDAEQIECSYLPTSQKLSCGERQVWVQLGGDEVTGFIVPGRHPKQLAWVISNAAGELLTGSVEPSYTLQQPNGPDCPPTCRNAQVKL